MASLFDWLRILLSVLTWAIIARSIMSWISPRQTNVVAVILYRITEPLLSPLRRIIPTVGSFDLTPLAAIILLRVIGFLLPY